MSDELRNRARENASTREDQEWGERVTLDPGDDFEGRWRGETTTPSEYGEQPVYLLWDRNGAERFLYGGRVTLDRKIRAANLVEGDSVFITRIEDDFANGRTTHRYGVASEPNSDPLPSGPEEPDW
jgi:hypothetical protein